MARHNECRTEGVSGEVIGRKKPGEMEKAAAEG